MTESSASPSPNRGKRTFRGVAVLVASIAVGTLLTFLLLEPAGSEIAGLAVYLLAGSLVSVGLTEALIRNQSAFNALRLRPRLVIAFVFVMLLGLLNILALSVFMFVNTEHDLPMLFAILAFAGGVSVYVAYRLAEGVSGALERLAEGVKSVSTGELSTRVPEGAGDEIGDVSRAFNEMAARLEEAQRRQTQLEEERKQFTAALSHDLRTPLASARVMLEAVRDGVVSDADEQSEYLRRTLVEVRNLSDLVDDLFEISLLDAGALRLNMSPTPLQEMVLSSVEGMSVAAKSKGVGFEVKVDETCGAVVMDGLRVRRALMNLVQNAIRHTPADGSVTVAAHDDGDHVTVEVRDTGEGIAADDLPKIWTRSYRADPSRTRDINGLQQTGLGLATAKAIIELHGGWVSVTSSLGEGSSFTFGLPKKASVA